MIHFTSQGLEAVRAFAEARGLTVFVYCGYTFVMDGGSAAYRQGGEWESGFGCSSRKATEEEEALWLAFGGPTGDENG
jgi:hypothetical protein